MQKTETLLPGKVYKIIQHGNGHDILFFNSGNKSYFQKLVERHLMAISVVLDLQLEQRRIQVILKIKPEEDIPEKYREKLHLPISNLFNSYAKSINKRYNRKGSLFRVRFERQQLQLPE
ncbi:MAG: hypothetical protein EOO51_01345 [Flavobacterium sp.]|nr:MAG: hypothetical protein EOO51_01345 [Flavobacterium sp.]